MALKENKVDVLKHIPTICKYADVLGTPPNNIPLKVIFEINIEN